MAFFAKSSNARRVEVSPAGGVLDLQEATQVSISCEPFSVVEGASVPNDSVTIEWVNVPSSASKQFNHDALFPVGAATRRKEIAVEYNIWTKGESKGIYGQAQGAFDEQTANEKSLRTEKMRAFTFVKD